MRPVFLLLFLCGCGYRWQPDFPERYRPSIVVPYVSGDEDGTLTSEIIRAIAASGIASIISREGDYRLLINIVSAETESVGYRRDRQKITGEIKKNLIASEGRKTVILEAALYEGSTDRVAYGPYRIGAEADYDYVDGDSLQDLTFVNAAGVLTTVLPFSLGQLESIEAAQEAALRPLNERLAQKIVDAIFSEW
jgi:hypothetical protein